MLLANMKGSRFVKAFDEPVDYWERTLSHIMEVVEMILQVQRHWMYLEVSPLLLHFIIFLFIFVEYFHW